MIVLTLEQITKNYGVKPLMDHVDLTIETGDRIGVIGVNGTGKSTFLRVCAGMEEVDSGKRITASGMRVGYLPQSPDFTPGTTVWQEVLRHAAQNQKESAEFECWAMLTRLGITDFDQDVSTLSGGQKKRVAMAAALAGQVELLILDEPTNHIDSATVEWLETYLAGYRGALLMVTHDRYFLERVCNRMVELDNGILTPYPANYSKYLELKAEKEAMEAASLRKKKALYRKELEWIHRGARARTTKAQFRVNRFEELKDAAKAPVAEQELELSSLQTRLGKKIVEIDSVSKSYGDKVLFHDFSYNLLRRDRLGIIGPNGCGKTTLLRVMQGIIQPDSGEVRIGETVKIGYFSQECEGLDDNKTVLDTIRDIAWQTETPEGTLTASQMLEKFLFPGAMQHAPVGRLSGGEKRRLYLLCILMTAPNILLLDEPTNDLDIQTLTILEDYLDSFSGTVISISHDRYFLDRTAEHVFVFEPDGTLTPYLGGYTDYRAAAPQPETEVKEAPKKKEKPKREPKLKFSFKEQREFETIDDDIASLEEAIAQKEREIEENASRFDLLPGLLAEKEELEARLDEKTERWVYLNELAEKIEQSRLEK